MSLVTKVHPKIPKTVDGGDAEPSNFTAPVGGMLAYMIWLDIFTLSCHLFKVSEQTSKTATTALVYCYIVYFCALTQS